MPPPNHVPRKRPRKAQRPLSLMQRQEASSSEDDAESVQGRYGCTSLGNGRVHIVDCPSPLCLQSPREPSPETQTREAIGASAKAVTSSAEATDLRLKDTHSSSEDSHRNWEDAVSKSVTKHVELESITAPGNEVHYDREESNTDQITLKVNANETKEHSEPSNLKLGTPRTEVEVLTDAVTPYEGVRVKQEPIDDTDYDVVRDAFPITRMLPRHSFRVVGKCEPSDTWRRDYVFEDSYRHGDASGDPSGDADDDDANYGYFKGGDFKGGDLRYGGFPTAGLKDERDDDDVEIKGHRAVDSDILADVTALDDSRNAFAERVIDTYGADRAISGSSSPLSSRRGLADDATTLTGGQGRQEEVGSPQLSDAEFTANRYHGDVASSSLTSSSKPIDSISNPFVPISG